MAIQVALRNKAKESASILPANPKYLALSNNFGESDGELTGSSPSMLVKLVNSGLLPKDARIATRKNIKKVIKRKNDFLSGHYADCGLNLDSRDADYKINPFYARALAEDLDYVGINLKNAKLIPYNILTYKINKESPEGLVFKLSKEGKDTAKELILNTNDFKWDYKPSVSGLFGACFYWDGGWDCGSEGLAGSASGGRVVVITGEASSRKILGAYSPKFKEDRDKVIANVNNQYRKMIKSLRIE